MERKLLLGSGGYRTDKLRKKWSEQLDSFLGDIQSFVFIPYALKDYDKYVEKIDATVFTAERTLLPIHKASNPAQAIEEADAIFVGGGNSFLLLKTLYDLKLIEPIKRRVMEDGVPYIGISAGTNMACPTMKTTNDMPIVYPPSFSAFGFISLQINPHYFSGPTYSKAGFDYIEHGGETRDDRIREFLEQNGYPVVGLYEGSAVEVEGDTATLMGDRGARLFMRNSEPTDYKHGMDLSPLLQAADRAAERAAELKAQA